MSNQLHKIRSFSSMFEEMGKSSIFPSIEDFNRGIEQSKYAKEPFIISSYNVEVFNMMEKEDRDKYCNLMMKLTPLAQNSKCVICKNDLQVLNGSSWQRYVEWFEYKLNDKTTTTKILDSSSDEDIIHNVSDNNDNGLID